MISEAELSKLILLVYEAATEPSLWPKFMKRYTEALDADLAVVQVHHFDAGRSEALAQFGMNPRFNTSYNEHYSKMISVAHLRAKGVPNGLGTPGGGNLSEASDHEVRVLP
jgi:hypothetical protein